MRRMQRGFTLIELIVVMAIMGLLIGITASSFQTSRIKGKDAKRKSDLRQIGSALEAYNNDHGHYPAAAVGVITACGGSGTSTCAFGSAFTDENGTTYMAQIPAETNFASSGQTYVYIVSSNQKMFQLFARLENTQDPDIKSYSQSCGGGLSCNYGISSPNTTTSTVLP